MADQKGAAPDAVRAASGGVRESGEEHDGGYANNGWHRDQYGAHWPPRDECAQDDAFDPAGVPYRYRAEGEI